MKRFVTAFNSNFSMSGVYCINNIKFNLNLSMCLCVYQSVMGTKPFKAKKKRGGRFGLKRLKEKRREELVIEGTPPRLDMSDVDVEFSLPKFKQKRSAKVAVERAGGAAAVGKAKRKIRLVLSMLCSEILIGVLFM